MLRRTLHAVLLSVTTVVGLSACSLPVSMPGPTPTVSPASGPPSANPRVGSDAGGSGGPSTSADTPPAPSRPSDQLGPIVASRTTSDDGKAVHVDLYRIVRDGSLSHVTLALRSRDDVMIDDLLSDNRGDAGQSDPYAADGVTLSDTAHKKLYLVASDGHGNCLCTQLGGLTLSDDRPSIISATFAAPPVGITTMDVTIPHFGVFPRVPVV